MKSSVLRRPLVIFSLSVATLAIVVVVAVTGIGSLSSSNCHAINDLKSEIRIVLGEQLTAVSTSKSTSAVAQYYKAHPDQLAQLRKVVDGDLALFAPSSC